MKKGFTLIELLGILALLGVIIIVSMPSLIRSNQAAKNNQNQDACNIILTACDSYRIAEGKIDGDVNVNTLREQGYLKSDSPMPEANGDTMKPIDNLTITQSGCEMPSNFADVCK